jgi:plastocyanin
MSALWLQRMPRVFAMSFAASLLLALLANQPSLTQTLAQTAPSSSQAVTITDTGFQPASVTLNPGDGIHWTNASSQTQTVTADDGLFDSGPIPIGGGFSLAIAIPGTHAYGSTSSPA